MVMDQYQVLIKWSDEDKAFIAEAPDLPGAMADGETRLEALENIETVIQEWIETAKELGRPVPPPSDKVVSVPEAAQQLGLSTAMVRRYCSTGALPAQKIGRDWTLRQRDVEQFSAKERRPGRKAIQFK